MRLLNPLFTVLAAATDSQLARMVEYLKVENRILRDKLTKRLKVTPHERNRLVKVGRRLGGAIKDLITIVSPRTFARWVAGIENPRPARTPERRGGRPRTPEAIRSLVLRIAHDTGWGYCRILGELKKLGIGSVSRSTVVNILKEQGLDPSPERVKGTWDDFLRRHAATLWACDFLSVKSWTLTGVVDLYLLVFIHVGTRRVIVSSATASPTGPWVAQQARNATMSMEEMVLEVSHLLIDHDTKFTAGFDAVFEAEGAVVKRVGPAAPNLNAHVERVIQTLKVECFDHFVICGEKHLQLLAREFLEHYHEERPHQGRGNVPLSVADCGESIAHRFPNGPVVCRERFGGLLKHYERAAA